VKDIESHKSLWSFTGVIGEQELILLRAGIFTAQHDVSNLSICPFPRSELGIGWRKSSKTCRVPDEIAHHSQGKGKTKSVKGDRVVGDTCDRCLCHASVVNEIEDALKEAECTNDTREELFFVASQAKQHRMSGKPE